MTAALDPQRWKRLKSIFDAVVDLPPGERASAIEEQCDGDDVLRRELLSLLEADERASQFIEAPAAVLTQLDDFRPEHPATIGPWRILREINRGGMGTVYLAEREGEYRQQVAVKLIRRGMDSEHIVSRFRNERQILASLDHPNIAHLLDGGTTADGQPYFVMEYIEGTPITQYCDEHGLDLGERMALFQTVCSAVQYAHRNLIVHRDIKPANVLVTNDGVPKLLDFGIAKVLDLSREGAETATEQRALTPDYASPEQISGERITTATDIYSLGLVLYELLTGTRPYRGSGSAAILAEAVSKTEFERPSTAVRQTSPASRPLLRKLRGDIDNILLLALRKDPARRYPSAQALADDIGRHLAGQPVVARPDTFSYRAGKFVRRNRGAVLAAALAIVALLAGAAAATWQAVEAKRAQERAERRFTQLRKLARALIFDLEPQIAQLSGATAAREQLVSNALVYLDSLASESAEDAELQLELASAYRQIAEVQGNPFGSNLGRFEEARLSYQKGLGIAEKALSQTPRNPDAVESLARLQEGMADVLSQQADLEKSNALYTATLATWERLATLRKPTVADQRAVALVRVKRADLLGNAGVSNLGRYDQALAEHRRALALREALLAANPTHERLPRDVAESLTKIAFMQNSRGQYEAAALTNRRAVEIAERIAKRNPDSANDQQDYSVACMIAMFPLRELGRYDEAVTWVQKSLAIMEKLAAKDPQSTIWQRNLSVILNNLSTVELESGDYQAAARASERSIAIATKIWEADRTNNDGALDLTISRRKRLEALLAARELGEVVRRSPEAIELAKTLDVQGNARVALELSLLESQLGTALAYLGRSREGLSLLDGAIRRLESQVAQNADDIQTRDDLARTRLARGEILMSLGADSACADIRASDEAFRAMDSAGKLRFRSRAPWTRAKQLAGGCS